MFIHAILMTTLSNLHTRSEGNFLVASMRLSVTHYCPLVIRICLVVDMEQSPLCSLHNQLSYSIELVNLQI